MNAELFERIEKISQLSVQAKAGDISTLAELLDQVETFRQYSEINGISELTAPFAALGEHLKSMIMGDHEDDEGGMKVIHDTVSLVQSRVAEDEYPALGDYPAALNLTVPGGEAPSGDAGYASMKPEGTPDSDLLQEEGVFAADKELLAEYLEELRNRLEEIEGNLLALEKEVSEAALDELRRALHTIKGDSGFLGLSPIVQIMHSAEGYLEDSTPPLELEPLFAVKDWLARVLDDLTANGEISAASNAAQNQLSAQLDGSEGEVPSEQAGTSAGDSEYVAPLVEESTPMEYAPVETAGEPSGGLSPPDPESAGQETRIPLTADESLLVDFISESKEHLEEATAQLLSLENEPDNEEAINSVFRAFHTVKGIAGFLDLEQVQKLAHDTESLLDLVRRNELALSPTLTDLVFEALDWMIRLIGNVGEGLQLDGTMVFESELPPFLDRIKIARESNGGAPSARGKPVSRIGEILVESGAVAKEQLEDAMEEARIFEPEKKLGEVLIDKKLVTSDTIDQALKEQQIDRTQTARKAVELKETLRVDYERLENMINTIGELVLAEAMINQENIIQGIHSDEFNKKLHNLRQVSRKLQELGTTIRMVPISGTFQKMARLVRDLSRKSNKPIKFTTHGDETELDRAYVDLIADPLVHMIRNAVDHGIEAPKERAQGGKPEQGVIELRAFHEGGNIHVEISDDGKGLDPEVILKKALEKGMISEEEKLTDQEIYQLIFLPGFSTASAVTEVSGRGVGMDVVRRNIKELRGQVQIVSEMGVGSTFKLILPLTLALIDGMLVKVGQERFIFPVLSVVESVRPMSNMIHTVVGKGEMITLRNRQLPLYRLNRLFQIPGANEEITESLVVVVENDGRQMGIVVDDLVGMQQTVIKSLGQGMIDSIGLSGGSIMADGMVGLILDVHGLMKIARAGGITNGEQIQNQQS